MVPCIGEGLVVQIFLEHISFLELQQVNSIQNRQNKILDLILCDEFKKLHVRRSKYPIVKIDSFRPALELDVECGYVPVRRNNVVDSVCLSLAKQATQNFSNFIPMRTGTLLLRTETLMISFYGFMV